jgi:hypothetical protein
MKDSLRSFDFWHMPRLSGRLQYSGSENQFNGPLAARQPFAHLAHQSAGKEWFSGPARARFTPDQSVV